MGVDSRGIHRGACSHPGCCCGGFQRGSGTVKCFACNHPPVSHKRRDEECSRVMMTPSPKPTASPTGYPNIPQLCQGAGQDSRKQKQDKAGRQGKRPSTAQRAPAPSVEDIFNPSSQTAKKEKNKLNRKEDEQVKVSVSHDVVSQPPTRAKLQSAGTPTTEGATCGAPPTQQPASQELSIVMLNCKVSKGTVRAMSFYDMARLQTVKGTRGILVTSIEVNKDTLDCGVQPLDLITHLDGTPVESLCDQFGQCFLKIKMTQSSADMWVARTSRVPSMSGLQIEGLVEPHQSGRKHRIVGFLVTQKDLVDPASFLGVRMHEYSKRKAVTMVTAEGVVGPETEWSFEGIKRIARDSPSVCALLMTVMNV